MPDESKTTSLKGGTLHPCELFTSDTTGNLKSIIREGKPSAPSGDLKLGDMWAIASGTVLAGQFVPTNGKSAQLETDADGQPVFKVGRVWGGGKVHRSRQYYVMLNPTDRSPRVAYNIAERMNTTFHATAEPNLKVAEAEDAGTHPGKRAIRIPQQPLPLPVGRPADSDSGTGPGQRCTAGSSKTSCSIRPRR